MKDKILLPMTGLYELKAAMPPPAAAILVSENAVILCDSAEVSMTRMVKCSRYY